MNISINISNNSVESGSVGGVRKSTCNILFWNIHGQVTKIVGNKFTDTEFLKVCNDFDILGIVELHTKNTPSIQGYKLIKDKIRDKRHNGPKISGGIAIFAKKEIAHMVKYVPNNHEDSVWVKLPKEVTGETKDIYIGTCYISPPPRNNPAQPNDTILEDKHKSLEKIFREAQTFSQKGEVILQGDINARIGNQPDFLSKDKFDDLFGIENQDINPPRNSEDKTVCERGSILLDLCRSFDYLIANGRKPGDLFGKYTSIQWNGSAVVDYVITPASTLQRIVEFKVGDFVPCISDHCPLEYKIKLKLSKQTETPIDMKKLPPRCKWNETLKSTFLNTLKTEENKEIFEHTLEDTNITPEDGITLLSSTLLKCASWNSTTTENKEKRKQKSVDTHQKPWFDKDCKEAKRKINTIAKQLKHKPNDPKIRESLFSTKRTFKNLIKKKKLLYKQSIIQEMQLTKASDIKKYWRLLKKLDLNHCSTKNLGEDISPNEWVNHYTQLLQVTDMNKIPANAAESGPLDYQITLDELMKAKSILKPGKATGIDTLSNEMISEALKVYPTAFLNVMNILMKEGKCVSQWLTSLLVPIHKKGPVDNPDNYRGIALISCLAKFFYAILNNRLMEYCLKHKILSPSQLGFLAGNRTSDAHIIIYNLIKEYCHKRGLKIYSCFVDFSKAFDSIPRDRMFQKLLDIGITGKFYDLIKFIYEGDQLCIKIDDAVTPSIKTMMGVRQGCVLSPLLFNIFMADFPRNLSPDVGVQLTDNDRINCILWADDIILLAESEEGLNDLLRGLHTYSEENKLKVNTDKTKCMIFNKTGRLIRRDFYLGSSKLENVRSYKYLGLIITPSGEIKSGLDDLRSRALKAYMALKSKLGISFRDNIEDTICLFDSLVKPILLYGSDFWGCLKLPKNNPVENLHMQFCRQLLGVQKNTTTHGVLLELGRTPIIIEAQRLSIKNWERINSEKGNILVCKSHRNACAKNLDWHQTINNLLTKHELQYSVTEPARNNVANTFSKRAKDAYHHEAFSCITNPESKLRTYGLIKHTIGREEYLTQTRNPKQRQKFAKFRLSNHKLMIEVGRHYRPKLEKEMRICPLCLLEVEDEMHFLIRCKIHEPLRKPIFAQCTESTPQFKYYSAEEKFIYIMTNPCMMMGNVSRLLDGALGDRDIYLAARTSLDGILDKIDTV